MSEETLPTAQHPLHRLTLPCDHNAWNNARMKGKTASLTCRFCPAQWKATNLMEIVCPEFRETGRCPLSVSCPYLHINRHKRKDFSSNTFVVDPLLRCAALEVITSRPSSNRVWPSDILIDIQQKVAQISVSVCGVQDNNGGFSATLAPSNGRLSDCYQSSSLDTIWATDSTLSNPVNPHRLNSASQSLLPPPSSPIAAPMPVLPCDSLPSPAALVSPSIDLNMFVSDRFVPQQRSIRKRLQEEKDDAAPPSGK